MIANDVAQLVRLYRQREKPLSYPRIAQMLKEAGIRDEKGRLFTAKRVRFLVYSPKRFLTSTVLAKPPYDPGAMLLFFSMI